MRGKTMSTAGFQPPPRSAAVSLLSTAISAFRWAILALILILLAPYALAQFDNAARYAATNQAIAARDYVVRTFSNQFGRYIPTRIAGRDRTDWILIGGLLVCALAAGSLRRRVQLQSARRQMRKQAAMWRQQMRIQENSAAGRELETKLQGLESGGNMNRDDLLKVFADVKKKLDQYGREVAFLSIDVVGSTAMKRSEDPAAAQYDFQEYRKMVEAVFRSRGVLKSAWTPDGVMACFAHVDDAVAAGQDVIRSLEHFNANVKLMKSAFMVRCGVNAGYVHFDDATPMETMSDRVIDIAGHMQKYAEPNTVAVARKLIEPLRDLGGFQPTGKTVDGYQVSHWIYGRN
jgi:class 3 adenylate cyclase